MSRFVPVAAAAGVGDVSAEDRWLEAWRQRERLLRIARRRVPTREDAEDVVAEAIQRAGAQGDLPVGAVPAWVTRVTINLCLDRQRRLATQRAALSRAELRPEALPTHEEEVLERAEAAWLTSKLEELPLRQALAVRLRADGISNVEIASLLDVSQASVDGLLKRSRAALRHALRAAGALVAAAWAGVAHSRRSAVVLAAGVAVLVALLPWTGSRVVPEGAPPAAPGSTLEAASPAVAVRESVAALTAALSGAGHPSAPPAQRPPGIGHAVPYHGPRCLAPYCLPVLDDAGDKTLGASSPRGWSPADLHHYLGEPAWSDSAAARRPLVAVVGPFDFPWLTADLAHYRRTFRLPPCEEADGCLQVRMASAEDEAQEDAANIGFGAVQRALPRAVGLGLYSLAAGQAQMLQAVSAACPECRLALISAETDSAPDLAEAFRVAQSIDPEVVVTNLSRTQEADRSMAALEDARLYEGALVVAGAGLLGFTSGPGPVPNRYPDVVTVGSTSIQGGLVVAASENGSFCNRTTAQPPWQRTQHTGCVGRAGVDLVLPGDPANGLATYISGGLPGPRGWYHPGRHSQAVGIFGGLLARHNLASVVRGPGDLYAHPEWFADVTTGFTDCTRGCVNDTSNPGQSCRPSERQLCEARSGWDGLTGLGEPRYLPWR